MTYAGSQIEKNCQQGRVREIKKSTEHIRRQSNVRDIICGIRIIQ